MKKLIIFVDALPFKKIDLLKKVSEELKISKIKPSYGYSVNLHYLMFDGKTPDDVGFFGEYKFNNDYVKEKDSNILKNIDITLEKLKLEFFRKAFRKFILKINDMIPYKRRKFFKKEGKYFFRELNESKVYMGEKYEVYLEELDKDLPKNFIERCNVLEEKITKIIRKNEKVIISLYSLDYCGHLYGTDKKEYDDLVIAYDKMLSNIIVKAKEDEFEKIVLVSDHGMTSTKKHISLEKFEEIFGEKFGKDVVYFYDSLYFSAKSLTKSGDKIVNKIREYFKEIEGSEISLEEREKYGINDNAFGEFIFVLNDGLAFSPNYFGYSKLNGYHGYAPGNTNQYGIVALNNFDNLNREYTSEEFNNLINSYLRG